MVSLYLGPVIYCISSGKYPDAESTLIKIRTLVVAPLCEEIIFRKIILTLLLSAYDTKKAILLALASFSLRKWTFEIYILAQRIMDVIVIINTRTIVVLWDD